MAKSVTEPISQAYERTAAMLFKPFEIRKWFVLGFAAFLAQLGEGGLAPEARRTARATDAYVRPRRAVDGIRACLPRAPAEVRAGCHGRVAATA